MPYRDVSVDEFFIEGQNREETLLQSRDEWKLAGRDANSRISDPLFIDIKKLILNNY